MLLHKYFLKIKYLCQKYYKIVTIKFIMLNINILYKLFLKNILNLKNIFYQKPSMLKNMKDYAKSCLQ